LEVFLAPSRAGSLSLVGGVLALDFANTSGGRGTARQIEHLQMPAHLVDWAAHAGGIDAGTAERCHAAMASDPRAAEQLLHHALLLREAIFAIGSAIAYGEAPPPADLGILKGHLRRTIGPAELTKATGDGYGFDFSDAPPEAALLGPVAWSALDLLERGSFERIKQCPADDCGWLFFDHSRNDSRRWCDMATCGNRTKGRRHRERH
jgi:predicted RNA-binding Zn ribbon-like protein